MRSLKLALRNLRRNGVYSIVNITGLAVSLAACILITLWIQDELSFDKFNRNAKDIYRLNVNISGDTYWAQTPAPLAIKAKAENPEIVDFCRHGGYSVGYLEYEGKRFYNLIGQAVDTTFFDIFTFPVVDGNATKPFTDTYAMVLPETKAKAIFGDEDPVGKTLKASNGILFHVTAVAQDAPQNSSIQFDFLVPFDVQEDTFGGNGHWERISEDWGSYQYETYFLLHPHADGKLLAEKISQMINNLNGEGTSFRFFLQSLPDIHLYATNGEPQGVKQVWLFVLITIFILLIACINYVNLATARATKRRKEIAVRKIMGAGKGELLVQLLRESLLLFLLAFVISTVIIILILPFYNQLSGKEILFSLTNPSVWMVYGAMAVSVVVLAGIYPALLLASFKPLEAFRPVAQSKGRSGYLRKALVIVQFVFSFGLIVATVGISLQMKYLREKNLGYDKEHVFTIRARGMASHYDVVKNELLKNKDILGVAGADHDKMLLSSARGGVGWDGWVEGSYPAFACGFVQPDFYELMGVELASGSFPQVTDSTIGLLVNETAVRIMGMENAVGKRFELNKGNDGDPISGVMKDYHHALLSQPIGPQVMVVMKGAYAATYIYVKTTGDGAKSALASVEELWKQYNPDYEFSYSFLDDSFDKLYRSDLRTGKLLTIFAIIAIFTSCLGLFGLVTYTAETKTKEIGIRKTLGATVSSIVGLLSREFVVLVGISILVALPLSYYLLSQLLQSSAYHIPASWWIFVIAGLLTIVLTLLTVSIQAVKAARVNPVKSIKVE